MDVHPNDTDPAMPAAADDSNLSTSRRESGTEIIHNPGSLDSRRSPSWWSWLALIAVVFVGWVAARITHERLAVDDEQNANLTALMILVGTGLVALAILATIAIRSGRGRWFAAGLAATLVLAIVLLRFEGFNGEMRPQFAFRFGEAPPPLEQFQALPAETASQIKASSSNAVDASSLANGSLVELSFSQFLGNERRGVVEKSFRVPRSVDEVETLWRIGVGEGWSSFAVARGVAVTLEQRDEDECVTAYSLGDGSPLWIDRVTARHENSLGGIGPRSTPSIDGDRVYTHGGTGQVRCLRLSDGELIWGADLLAIAGWDQAASEAAIPWGRSASPLVVDGPSGKLVVLPLGAPEGDIDEGRSLIALDADTGETVWRAGFSQISFASPVVMTFDGQRQIVSVNEGTVTGHDIETGDQWWAFDWPGRSSTGPNCASAVPIGDDQFLVGKGYGGGSSLAQVRRDNDGQWSVDEVWHSSSMLKTKFNHAVVRDGVGYGIGNGTLEAIDLSGPKRLWRGQRGDRVGQGQLLLAGDVLVAQAEEGEVRFIAADPEGYDKRLTLPALTSKTWNIPTLAGNLLLVRNDREAICFRLPRG